MNALASPDRRRGSRLALVLLAGCLAACAPRTTSVVLPSGTGTPIEDDRARELAAAVAAACQATGAITADLRVAGRVDGDRVRGTLQLGIGDGELRIEGVPPFGAPLFVLAGRADAATLLFVRENAYVRDAPVTALTEALVGLPLAPADLLALLGGCGVPVGTPVGGVVFGDQWARVDFEAGTRLWIHTARGGAPRLRVAETAAWRLDYAEGEAGAPVRGTLSARGDTAGTRLSFEVVAPERLPALPPAALDIVIPDDARRVPLADLRRRRVLAAS